MNYSKGNYYHIFNRGANREPIFFNETNYLYLLKLIKKYLEKYDITLACYCLMLNHYHFIARQNSDAPISRFLQTTFNAYTQAVNKQQNRKGTLFESRPKSIQIDDESYLVYLFRYIHLNPFSAGLVSSPEQWAYSNYCEFIGQRNDSLFDKELFHKYFDSGIDYKNFVLDFQLEQSQQEKVQKYLFD